MTPTPCQEKQICPRRAGRLNLSCRLRHPLLGARQIELSPAALSSEAMTAVLTHEAAHAALAQGKRKVNRPHGSEWRRLMAQAGQPDARANRWCRTNDPKATKPKAKSGTRTPTTWCPVCQASRPAKRPVRAWRCAACVAAGLPGRLEITPARGPAQAYHP